MTPVEINIAIAEWMGWKNVQVWPGSGHLIGTHSEKAGVDVPDFYNDLNAVHEAERRLLFSQRIAYRYMLRKCIIEGELVAEDEICHAAAPPRCVALLRSLGRWKWDRIVRAPTQTHL